MEVGTTSGKDKVKGKVKERKDKGKGKKFDGECAWCKKWGHKKKDCFLFQKTDEYKKLKAKWDEQKKKEEEKRKRKDDRTKNDEMEVGNIDMAVNTPVPDSDSEGETWVYALEEHVEISKGAKGVFEDTTIAPFFVEFTAWLSELDEDSVEVVMGRLIMEQMVPEELMPDEDGWDSTDEYQEIPDEQDDEECEHCGGTQVVIDTEGYEFPYYGCTEYGTFVMEECWCRQLCVAERNRNPRLGLTTLAPQGAVRCTTMTMRLRST